MKFKKLNKRAYSIGFSWMFALISIFGIGLLFIVFDQIFLAHLVPVIKNQVNGSDGFSSNIGNDTKLQIFSGIDKYMAFWHAVPFILFGVIVIYMVVSSIRREGDEGFGGYG